MKIPNKTCLINVRIACLFLMFILFFSCQSAFAQRRVSGTVTDRDTNEPLTGATILITGTSHGTITNSEGAYNIEIPKDTKELIFSFVGYTTQTIEVDNRAVVDVSMKAGELLEELVVVGYGTARKKDLTGVVDLVNSDDFNKGPNTSTQQLLQGKIAGVSVCTSSGAPGEGASILIRGVGSLNLSANPLYVVDGVPLNDTDTQSLGIENRGIRNPLNLINPDDIESITVLKDASSTAIYGSRAANGVVVITTKSGKGAKKELKVNISSGTSIYSPIKYVDLFNANEFREVIRSLNNAEDFQDDLGSANTNWQDEIYTTSVGTDNALSITGKVLHNDFRVSLGYTNQDGILKTDNFERITSSISFSPKFFNNALRTELKGRFMNTKNEFANKSAIYAATVFNPTLPVYDENSLFRYTTYLNDDGTLQRPLAPTNPVALLDLVSNHSTVNSYISNLKADLDLPFLSGLTVTINAGIDYTKSDGKEVTDKKLPTSSIGFNGINTTYQVSRKNLLFDTYLNYSKTINKVNQLSITVGHSFQKFKTEDDGFKRIESFVDSEGQIDNHATRISEYNDAFESTLLSYFGRFNYSFNSKFLATATLRADASSKLNPNDRWGYFPSVALAWNLQNESFLKESIFDLLKPRIGYGEVGNVSGLTDYTFLTRYFASNSSANYQIGDTFYTTYRPEPINESLKWEVGNTFNIGVDYGILDGRIKGSINAYVKKTNDLIATSEVDPLTNFGNSISANIGDMKNKGIELDLNFIPVMNNKFRFGVGFNVSFNDNEITRLSNPQEIGIISGTLGDRIQRHEVGHAPYSFYVYKQLYDQTGNPIEGAFADLNGDQVITGSDRYFFKDPFADVLMGLTLELTYKNFDLTLVSRASLGNYVFNNNAAISRSSQLTSNENLKNQHRSYLQTQWINLTTESIISDYWIENASFFKLDNVTIGYTITNLIGNSSLRVYLTGSNLFIASKYKGIDPEIPGGIDNNFYPRPRIYTAGLAFNF
ncbi:MAG: SusC/RagA family TonB-linked outer membrane protein [Prolixibacteraceae bacterium]